MNLKTFIAVLMFAQGCATVHNGRHQEVSVVTDPAGADVEVRCGRKQPPRVTPTTVRLPRSVDDCSIVLTREGFQPETVVFDPTPNRWYWANLAGPIGGGTVGATRGSDQAFVDFLIGAAIGGFGFGLDAITGAMWEFAPDRVERKLVPK
ncbi:MAG TPA: hypothetical protein VNI54_04110 [Thermoanaerobaculia bacterium]|nr:hypothetical protein [Thermoanaerobaculia bacterium]